MTHNRRTLLASSFGLTFGLAALVMVLTKPWNPKSADATAAPAEHPAAVATSARPIDIDAFLKPHLDRASTRTAAAVEARTEEVRSFFQKAQGQTEGFVTTALGWSSKWAMLVDAAPFNGSGRHERFLQAEFERQVFSAADLTKAIEQAVTGFVGDLTSIENRMLVDIRADLNASGIDVADHAPVGQQADETLRKILDTSATAAKWDAAGDVATLVAAVVIERAIARALSGAARTTGTSAAVLGTGTAASGVSFGISIAVALVVDQILSKVWDWAMDPAGNLQASLNEHLRELGDSICEGRGDGDREGLRSQMRKLATERSAERGRAVRPILIGWLR